MVVLNGFVMVLAAAAGKRECMMMAAMTRGAATHVPGDIALPAERLVKICDWEGKCDHRHTQTQRDTNTHMKTDRDRDRDRDRQTDRPTDRERHTYRESAHARP